MKEQEFNSIDDLLASELFRKWIIDKDEDAATFFSQWIDQNSARLEWVATAKGIIEALTQNNNRLTSQEINSEADRIQEKILSLNPPLYANEEPGYLETWNDDGKQQGSKGIPLFYRTRYVAGMAACLLMIAGIYWYFSNKALPASNNNAYKAFMQETEHKSFEYNNNSDAEQHIVLSDGSEVVLEKNSRLTYAANFSSGKREVYLEGNAFFNITRNPERPFIVYTQTIVTKVLGTSFYVKANTKAETASVVVKTGKVSVFKRENFTSTDAGSTTLKGMVVTPNQQVIYDILNAQMNKSLVEKPALANQTTYNFDFDDTPATEVFKTLQSAYGVPMLLDDEVLASCTISASLGNEPFYEKLRIICKIINATYEVIDGTVVISSKGCKG
ncbi:FecR family protein [Niastella sp. OAS944]|uniref:FecR family protein n=1 Tax=Niastella sp. OAS944 TaxID=2664089 RepID=UPI00348FCF5F|nr:ferric-dicitrate binding protein FerR (iron transport regulator) [Chitinophagaceae bacterium OAS944]